MGKIDNIIADYVTYYTETTGKSSDKFFENRGNEGDWLAYHIYQTMKKYGITDNDISNYKKSLDSGRNSANSECLSNSPTLCAETWNNMKKLIDSNILDSAIIWDPACGYGRLEKYVEDSDRLYLSTIEKEDVNTAQMAIEDATVFQNDFLNGMDYDDFNNYFSRNLPLNLVDELSENKPVIFMVEPPANIFNNSDIKDLVKREYSKQDSENGVFLYFRRILNLIEYYGLTNVYIVMVQTIEFNSWLQNMITYFKPIGGICYECNKVIHKYRASIVWKYEPVDVESDEYKERYTVSLNKFIIDGNNITSTNDFKFIIKSDVNYNRGATIAYQTTDGCFTNIATDDTEPVTMLDLHNKLTKCVLKHLIASGIATKNTTIDSTLVDEQWFTDCIPLFVFSKFNNFVSRGSTRNGMFPLNYEALGKHIADEKVLEDWKNNPAEMTVGRSLIKNNYDKMSSVARTFVEFCLQNLIMSYKSGIRSEMQYIDDTDRWDASISQIRSLSNIWSVETENTYNELQNDLVNYLAQSLMDTGAYKEG